MSASFGKIIAVLAEPINSIPDELITQLNKTVKPPEPVKASDIYVRAMFVVSDEINSFGGRFPSDEHFRLAKLLTDSPVLIGHRKDKLPIGRNFYSVLINRQGRQWIKSYFYWLKSADGAESLRENIDGGIYKECSIGFTYLLPECSVCGEDIRRCDHQPLEKVILNGVESAIHFNYRNIERVLETSLVYRGALPDTRVTKELNTRGPVLPSLSFDKTHLATDSPVNFQFEKLVNSDNARIQFFENGKRLQFLIRQFNINRLKQGVRFLAEYSEEANAWPNSSDNLSLNDLISIGEITRVRGDKVKFLLSMKSIPNKTFVLRSTKIGGDIRYLFYKLFSESEKSFFAESANYRQSSLQEITGETCL